MIISEPLQILLIGCGGITRAHMPAFKQFPDRLRLVGICDPSDLARAGVLAEYGEEVPQFADHEAMLSELARDADAALIVTPHHLHFPQAMSVVESGLPCLIEKPVVCNLGEARRLRDIALQRGIMVMAGQTRRHNRWAKHLHEWVRADTSNFGDLSTFSIDAWQNILCWIANKPDKNADFWILDKERAGGGVVVSLACHGLDMIRYLSGSDFAEVCARGVFQEPFKNGAESGCCATLTMDNGAVGTLHANYLAKRVPYSESFKLYGTRGSIVQHSEDWGIYDGEVRYGSTPDDDPPGWSFQYEGLQPVSTTEIPGMTDSAFTNQLLEFHSAVSDGREPLGSIANNINTIAVIEAIYQSMNNGGERIRVSDL